jgi:hypothetical protein
MPYFVPIHSSSAKTSNSLCSPSYYFMSCCNTSFRFAESLTRINHNPGGCWETAASKKAAAYIIFGSGCVVHSSTIDKRDGLASSTGMNALCFWCPRNGSVQMGMDTRGCMQRDDFLDGQQPSPTLLYVHHVSIHACVESHACIFCLFYG